MERGLKEFIYWTYLQDISLCDKIVEYYQKSDKKRFGEVSGGYRPEIKDSIDVTLEDDVEKLYVKQLEIACKEYIEQFPFCNFYSSWSLVTPINIQYYKPGGHFKEWHCERSGRNEPYTSRNLVFMTYLNDVTDGGETEWFHQELKIKPKKGLTVIWPPDWTYTHRGNASPTQEKYIVTGWFNYIKGD